MSEAARFPDETIAITMQEMTELQRVAGTHITFSLTLACPLKCAHCMVHAEPGRNGSTMSLAAARHYAAQMSELSHCGIERISVTGGEPLLAAQQLGILTEAAAEAGIVSGVVTSAFWAKSLRGARAVAQRFKSINDWDLSVDVYHADFVSQQTIRNALAALLDAGRRVAIRISHTDPPTADDHRLLEFVSTLEGAERVFQRVRNLGRAALLQPGADRIYSRWIRPCLTRGIVVRYDGSVGPCCVSLVEERSHPFQLGDASVRSLSAIHRSFLTLPLMQMIRAIGFSEVMRWVGEAGLDARLPVHLPTDVCELCYVIMRDQTIANYLAEMASEPETELKIAVLASRILGEHWMLEDVLARATPPLEAVAGYDLAEALLTASAVPTVGEGDGKP